MNAVSSQVKHHPSVTDALSAQEAALVLGKRSVHENVCDRALRLFERVRSSGKQPRVSLERAVYFTESFKQTEGQPIVLRWARALLHTTQNITINIIEDELIVGRPNNWFGKHGIIYPELDGSIMLPAIDAFRQTMVIMCSSATRSSQNWVIDHGKLLQRGLEGIRAEAQERLAAITNPFELTEKGPFLEAVIITCDALSTWARRYSEKARELAGSEADPQRRAELLEIAETCAWATRHPSRRCSS